VGCGAGGVALWLARWVGSNGAVVATDLDPPGAAAEPSVRDARLRCAKERPWRVRPAQ
jgi:hypothetical protein